MKTVRILTNVVILVTAFGVAGVAGAAPLSTAFTYQGRLIDANGTADGLYDLQFKLYDANTAGAQKGGDVNKPDVDVIDGYFTVELDFGSSAFDGNAVWLEIGVRPGNMDDPNLYGTLSPRQEITPTPYSLQTRGIFVDDAGNVGIGTSTPSYQLHTVDTTPGSDAPAIYGEHAVTDYYGIGVQGVGLYKGVVGSVSATGTGSYYGVYGSAGTSGSGGTTYGVYGNAGGGDASYGVYGQNVDSGNFGFLGSNFGGVHGESDAGYGVSGHSDSSYGVSGYSNSNYGVYGESSNGTGVYGQNADSNNKGSLGGPNSGVYGYSNDFGVFGQNINLSNKGFLGLRGGGVFGRSGSGYGVQGESNNGNGNGNFGRLGDLNYGVYGKNNTSGNYGYIGSGNYGVYGENSNGNKGYIGIAGGGVEGRSDSGFGVYGWSSSGYGVYGYSSSSYAGYFSGNVYATGSMSADVMIDRTPYPKDLATAYRAVMSMEKLPDGQYEEHNKEKQLDHSKLSDFIRSKDGNRDLSATVSALNEVVKDLIRKVEVQQQLIETQNAQIQQMVKPLQTNKQQPQIGITKGAVQ